VAIVTTDGGKALVERMIVLRLSQVGQGVLAWPISITTSERRTAVSDDRTVNSYPHFSQRR
jgi:hypothetical protein